MSATTRPTRPTTFILLAAILTALSLHPFPLASQAPGNGVAPALEFGAFNLPNANCRLLIDTALRANAFAIDAQSEATALAHNPVATVAITCYRQGSSPESHLVVLASSTNAGTAEWFKNDLRERVAQAAANRPVTGIGGAAPVDGNAVALQIGEFGKEAKVGDSMASGSVGLYGSGLKPRSHTVNELAAANASVSAFVEGVAAIGKGGNDLTIMTVIVVSTDSATAEFYRNDIRSRIQAAKNL